MSTRLFFATLCLAACLTSCVAALSSADVASLHDAQDNVLGIYRMPVPDGGGSPARAQARGAFCAVEAVLRRNNVAAVNSNGDIVCVKAASQ